jgi:hypothetical protein
MAAITNACEPSQGPDLPAVFDDAGFAIRNIRALVE